MRTSRSQIIHTSEKLGSGILVFLIGLAIFSTLGLDYIQWKRGHDSYVFSALKKKKQTTAEDVQREKEAKKTQEGVPISQALLRTIASSGVPDEAVNLFTDEEGVEHLLVDIPIKKYSELESSFFETFEELALQIIEKEEQQTAEKKYFLWQAKDNRDHRLTVLFSCEKEGITAARKTPPRPGASKVALIVDDMGYSLEAINELCSIGRPLTIAIIPYSPLASEIATISRQHDLEVILHLPLEAVNNSESYNSRGMITTDMSEDEVIAVLEKNLDQVPYIRGVNNHMGSKITANSKLMNIILGLLKERDLFFIDSRTTSGSVAYNVAQNLNIPSAYRHIFLDGEPNENYIRRQLFDLFRRAQKNGYALGICHPTKETLKVLRESFHLLDEYGLEPVLASQIVQAP